VTAPGKNTEKEREMRYSELIQNNAQQFELGEDKKLVFFDGINIFIPSDEDERIEFKAVTRKEATDFIFYEGSIADIANLPKELFLQLIEEANPQFEKLRVQLRKDEIDFGDIERAVEVFTALGMETDEIANWIFAEIHQLIRVRVHVVPCIPTREDLLNTKKRKEGLYIFVTKERARAFWITDTREVMQFYYKS
jgi:hypothetical protein